MTTAIQGWDERTVLVRMDERRRIAVTFNGPEGEMISIRRDGFYVRGERIASQGPDEARTVYLQFIKWLRAQGMAV